MQANGPGEMKVTKFLKGMSKTRRIDDYKSNVLPDLSPVSGFDTMLYSRK